MIGMSYTPTEWKTGDVITAEKLNNIESGIVGAGGGDSVIYYVDATCDDDEGYYYVNQGTYANITNALANGKIPYLRTNNVALAFYSGKNDVDEYFFSRIVYNASTAKIDIDMFIIVKTDRISVVSVEVNKS